MNEFGSNQDAGRIHKHLGELFYIYTLLWSDIMKLFLLICFSSTVNFVEEIERYIWVVLVFRLRCFVDGISVVEVGRMVGVGGSRALGLAA